MSDSEVNIEENEDERKKIAMKGILLDTINILYKNYDIRYLFYIRQKVEDAKTHEELKLVADMLIVIGRFHDKD